MKTKKFLSTALAMLAMLAVSMTAVSLTACSSDDDDDDNNTVSIYKQWEFVTSPDPDFASYVIDLSEQGMMKSLVKPTATAAAANGLSADKYYILSDVPCTITTNNDGKSGTIQIVGGTAQPFTNLTATTVTANGYACKVVAKKVVGEIMPKSK